MKNFSVLYFLIKVWMRVALKMHFLKVGVEGKTPIPKENGLLICANHQNAFLDGIIIAVLSDRQISFFSRSDVFHNPIAGFFLRQLNIIPIYRQRDKDGDAREKNVAVFEHAANYLANGGTMLIFPEGNHSSDRRLRPLQKGFARIAFAAMEKERAAISILPIGIDYGEHNGFWSGLYVRFGQLINVGNYRNSFEKNDRAALNELRTELKNRLQPLIPHLPLTELAPVEEIWWKWSRGQQAGLGENFFNKRRKLAERISFLNDEDLKKLSDAYLSYKNGLISLSGKGAEKKWFFYFKSEISSNLFKVFVDLFKRFGWFFDCIARIMTNLLVNDKQFYSGVRMMINQFFYFSFVAIIWFVPASGSLCVLLFICYSILSLWLLPSIVCDDRRWENVVFWRKLLWRNGDLKKKFRTDKEAIRKLIDP